MWIESILTIAIMLQCLAAYMAIRLIWITGNRKAWTLITVAVFFMTFRRCISFYEHFATPHIDKALTVDAVTGLLISIFMVVGIGLIGPYFGLMKRSRDDLMDSEERYRKLVEASPDIIVVHCDGKIVFVNKAGIETMRAASAEAIVGRPITDFLPPEEISKIRERISRVLDRKIVPVMEERTFLRADGTRIEVEGTGIATTFEGRPAVQVVVRDITERKEAQRKLNEAYEELERRVEERTADLSQANAMLRSVIDEKVRAEQALRESEEKFRALAENSTDTIMRFDRAHRHLYANAIVEAQTGIPREKFIGKTHEELGFPPELVKLWNDAIETVFQSKRPHRIEFRLPTGIWIDWLVIPEFSESEEVNTVLASAREITDRKKAEEALRESEQKYRDLVELAREGICIITDAKFVYVNRELAEMLGYSVEELIGTEFAKHIRPEELAYVMNVYHQHLSGENVMEDFESTFISRDGRAIVADINARVIQYNGKPAELVVLHDITLRKAAEEALSESENRFRTLIENSSDSIYRTDLEGRFTYINPAVKRLLGYEPEEIVGHHFTEYVHPAWREELLQFYRSQMKSRTPESTLEFKVLSKSGETAWVIQTVSLILKGGKATGYQAVVRDITARKRAEEELDRKARELARSNLELEQFAHIVSHDLQEPLRMVASYAQLLSQRYKGRLDSDADDFIHYTVDGAVRMQKLINALLEYSRVGRRGGEFRKTDCDEILNRVYINLQSQIEENGVQITKDPLPEILADESQLAQVFQNLIGNAVKFRSKEAPHVHVSARRDDAEWRFSVIDNGIGIAPEHQERVFVIFQRLHAANEYPGTGIGLAICKKIIERHGGHIWVESAPENGTTFHFTIPANPGSAVS